MKRILRIRNFFGPILLLYLFFINILPGFAFNNDPSNSFSSSLFQEKDVVQIMSMYKGISNEESICMALEMLKGTKGDYSRRVILGENETNKPIKIMFKDLSSINCAYSNADALGMKKGSQIYIYINERNKNAPVISIAALLAHEALHQDKFNSLSEETCAWTTEAVVWGELVEKYPQYKSSLNSLACREKTLALLYEKGGETDKYIKQIVYSSSNYANLPETSPGFSKL